VLASLLLVVCVGRFVGNNLKALKSDDLRQMYLTDIGDVLGDVLGDVYAAALDCCCCG